MTLLNLTLIVPCYNEHSNLEIILDHYVKKRYSELFHLLIVDNGSSDQTKSLLKHTSQDGVSSLRVEVNQGYGHGLLAGISCANTDLVGWIHADQSTLLDEVAKLIPLAGDLDFFIKGVRLNRPLSQRMFSLLMSRLCSWILSQKLYEINAQPSIYPRDFLLERQRPPQDFSIDLFFYYFAKRNGLQEQRIKIDFVDRLIGVSTWKNGIHSVILMGIKTLSASWKMRDKKCLK